MRCTRKWVLASSGTRPMRMKNIPNFACSEATITSKGRIMVMPTPTAAPFTAATSGFDARNSATQSTRAGRPPCPRAVSSPESTPSRRVWKVSCMSAPAQKPRPAPVITIAPTAGSALARSSASTCSSDIRGVQALRRSGRFSVISATSSRSLVADARVVHVPAASPCAECPSRSACRQHAPVRRRCSRPRAARVKRAARSSRSKGARCGRNGVRIALTVDGTRGDVHPMLALARRCARAVTT